MSQTTIAGRYLLAAPVDRTADGATVHQATDKLLGRQVSVTLVAEGRADLLRNAGTVEHRHLLPVHDAGTHRQAPYLVSDPYGARDLFDAAGQVPIAETSFVRSVVRQLAAGLDALAARDLVHLGLDPLAVRLEPSIHPADPGTVRLGRLHALIAAGATGATALADASFVAPEVAAGGAVGPAADRWSLAALAFTLLTGQPPFPATEAMSAAEVAKVATAKTAGEVPLVKRLRPADRRPVPEAVDAVLRRGLSPDPELRPATATEFAEAFASACEVIPKAPEKRPTESDEGTRPRRKLVVLGAAALVLVVGLLAWRMTSGDSSDDPDPKTEVAAGLPEAYRFVQEPLATGCGPVEPAAPGDGGGAQDVLRCASSGTTDRVQLVRFSSVEARDAAASRLLDEQIATLVTCSDPPLAPDADRPAALACFQAPAGGAQLTWVIDGRPVLATASTDDGTPAELEVWLREVSPTVIEEGR